MSRGRSRRQSIDEYLYGRGKYAKARSNKSNKQNHGKHGFGRIGKAKPKQNHGKTRFWRYLHSNSRAKPW